MTETALGTWETEIKLKGGSVFIEIPLAVERTQTLFSFGHYLRISNRAEAEKSEAEKRSRLFHTAKGTLVSFNLLFRHSITETEEKTYGHWTLERAIGGVAFPKHDGGSLPVASQGYDYMMTLLRSVLDKFESEAPEWPKIAEYRSHLREKIYAESRRNAALRNLAEADKDIAEYDASVAEILKENPVILEWLEE